MTNKSPFSTTISTFLQYNVGMPRRVHVSRSHQAKCTCSYTTSTHSCRARMRSLNIANVGARGAHNDYTFLQFPGKTEDCQICCQLSLQHTHIMHILYNVNHTLHQLTHSHTHQHHTHASTQTYSLNSQHTHTHSHTHTHTNTHTHSLSHTRFLLYCPHRQCHSPLTKLLCNDYCMFPSIFCQCCGLNTLEMCSQCHHFGYVHVFPPSCNRKISTAQCTLPVCTCIYRERLPTNVHRDEPIHMTYTVRIVYVIKHGWVKSTMYLHTTAPYNTHELKKLVTGL